MLSESDSNARTSRRPRFWRELVSYVFAEKDGSVPTLLHSVCKTDLQSLDRDTDMVVWLGHASYFIKLGGKRILIDPVFSASAAPLPYANKALREATLTQLRTCRKLTIC